MFVRSATTANIRRRLSSKDQYEHLVDRFTSQLWTSTRHRPTSWLSLQDRDDVFLCPIILSKPPAPCWCLIFSLPAFFFFYMICWLAFWASPCNVLIHWLDSALFCYWAIFSAVKQWSVYHAPAYLWHSYLLLDLQHSASQVIKTFSLACMTSYRSTVRFQWCRWG